MGHERASRKLHTNHSPGDAGLVRGHAVQRQGRASETWGALSLRRPFHLRIKIPGPSCDSPRCALAPVGRKYDCLERHPTWIAAEFLTQSLRQGVDDSIRIDAAARLYLVN
jgi:hypothetical protein